MNLRRKPAVRAGDEDGPHCGRCGIPNRPARSFCRGCGCALVPPKPIARSPLKRTRAQPPAAVSARKLSEQERRAALVEFVRARDKTCQADAVHALARVPCGGELDVHEVIPRSAWPKGYLVAENCLLVCRNAHRWIDNHPYGAHALGLHGFSWERPDHAL